jgi:hypothetical protein
MDHATEFSFSIAMSRRSCCPSVRLQVCGESVILLRKSDGILCVSSVSGSILCQWEHTMSVGASYVSGSILCQWEHPMSVGAYYVSGSILCQWEHTMSVGAYYVSGSILLFVKRQIESLDRLKFWRARLLSRIYYETAQTHSLTYSTFSTSTSVNFPLL